MPNDDESFARDRLRGPAKRLEAGTARLTGDHPAPELVCRGAAEDRSEGTLLGLLPDLALRNLIRSALEVDCSSRSKHRGGSLSNTLIWIPHFYTLGT